MNFLTKILPFQRMLPPSSTNSNFMNSRGFTTRNDEFLTKILPFQRWVPPSSTKLNFMNSCALPGFTSGESVTSFESIFSPEQRHTKVTALKFVLVATELSIYLSVCLSTKKKVNFLFILYIL